MKSIKVALASPIAAVIGATPEDVHNIMEYPPNPEMGDLAVPCFRFAKALRQSPQAIAQTIEAVLQDVPELASVKAQGGYVNLLLNRSTLMQSVVRTAISNTESLFSNHRSVGRTAVIDFSSPNIAKPFGVGHLRSTIIGQSLYRILQADGYESIGVNHLGDWGTQFGKNIAAYLKWGDEETVKRDPIRELLSLYVRFHKEAEHDKALEDEGRLWFKRLEEGDEQAVRLWKWFIEESLTRFRQTYDLLDVKFDHYLGESFYNDKMEAVVEELREKHLLVESDGAEVVDLSTWNMPPCIIRKSDGTTIYATRDLAAAIYRHDKLNGSDLLYVVGSEQSLHFQQVFKVLELMGKDWSLNCRHIAFGMMKYNGERLSTRRGKIVYLEDVLNRAIEEASAIIEQKNSNLADKARIAEQIGIGAVIFNDLKTYRIHDVDFRYEDVLNFDGETGPYVQYTHARASSVMRKADQKDIDVILQDAVFEETSDAEWNLCLYLAQANESLERAVDELDPSVIARYTLHVCHAFNRFYHDNPILTANSGVRERRLALTMATKHVLAYALQLIAIHAPEAM